MHKEGRPENQPFIPPEDQAQRAASLNQLIDEHYRLLSEFSSDFYAVHRLGADGKLTPEWLSGVERISGYTPEEINARGGWMGIVHPEDVSRLRAETPGFIHQDLPYEGEYRILTKAGEVRWLHVRGRAVLDQEGKIFRLYHAAQDITERKLAEQELRQLKDFNESIIQSMAEGIVIIDDNELFSFVNPAAARMLGYTPSELTGQHWKTITPLDQQPLVLAADQRRLRGESDQYELELVDKNGQRLTVLVSGSPRFVNGRLAGTLSVFTDITARKQIERDRESLLTHIYEQAQRIQQIIAAVPAGVCVLDADQRIVLANPVAEKGLLVLAMAHPGDRLTHLGDRSLTDLLASPPKGLWHEVKAPGRTFEIIARPIENFPIPQSWVLVINDATREREVQQRLQIQEQLATVGQLAAGIAHDFNNIMAVIVLYADMALLASDLSAKSRQQLQTIALQARRATDLIQQILDFGRRAVLERRPIDLAPFLKEQVKLLKRTLPENIAIHLSYSAGKFVVEADPTRIQQVIMNLSVNARDAMPEGGELRIGLEHLHLEHPDQVPLPGMKTGEWIRITVTDTGAGISPEVMPRIFEPFFTTKAPWGTGLGLSQVHGIVKQHGGEIDVTSKIGEGATFIIYLPAIAEAEPEALLLEKTALSQGHGEMILIVEDEAVIRSALTETLALLNYRSLEAPNGRHALEILEQQADIDLIITDAIMPEMGGIALLQALKERGIAVPVVMLTGHLMEADLKKLQAQGLKAWMSKPPRIEKLAQVVAQALQPPE